MWKTLSDLAKKLPYPLLLRLHLLKQLGFELRRHRQYRRSLGLPMLTDLDPRQLRRSDVLFVLGTGPSINRISEARWRAIAQYDTLGMNFWLYHRFVPRLFFFEAIDRRIWPETYSAFTPLAARRAADYVSVIKVVMELYRAGPQFIRDLGPQWKTNLYAVDPLQAPARNAKELAYALRFFERKGLFAPEARALCFFKHNTSLSLILGFAVRMRYRKVVLCGMDLKTNEYFYQDPQLYPGASPLPAEPKELPHLLYRNLDWLVRADAMLGEMNRLLLKPAGIELYVESRVSALWPEVPEVPADVLPQE